MDPDARAATRGRVRVGTSGWMYDHWKGVFYPPDLRRDGWLPYYAGRFRTVEVNNSFYRLPEAETFARWSAAVPTGFLFAVKASRFITHMKKLADAAEPIARLFGRASNLGEALGPVLFQLPPRWRIDAERLRAFLSLLPEGHRCAFEFRDATWFDERAYDALAGRNAALCMYDVGGVQSPHVLTADFAYLRFHGAAGPYAGRYGEDGLAPWVDEIRACTERGIDTYCYFNNDYAGHAVEDALTLRRTLAAVTITDDGEPVPPSPGAAYPS